MQMFNPEKQIRTYFYWESSHNKGWSRLVIGEGDEFHQCSAEEKPRHTENFITHRTTVAFVTGLEVGRLLRNDDGRFFSPVTSLHNAHKNHKNHAAGI